MGHIIRVEIYSITHKASKSKEYSQYVEIFRKMLQLDKRLKIMMHLHSIDAIETMKVY